MNVVLHREESKGMDEGHHGFTMGGGLGHYVNHRHIAAVEEQVLSFQLGSPESPGHGDCIQFVPVYAHLLVLECLLGKGTLTPLALKIATKPFIASVGEQLHIQAVGPVCVIQVTDPMPSG